MHPGQRSWGDHAGWQRPWVLRGSRPRHGRLLSPSAEGVEPRGEKQRAKPVAVLLLWHVLFLAIFDRQLLRCLGWGLLPAPSPPHPPADCSSCRHSARLDVAYPPSLVCSCRSSGRGRMGTVPSVIQATPRYPRLGMKVLPAARGCGGSFSEQRWILGPSPPGSGVRRMTVLAKGDAAPCSARGASAREPPPTPNTLAAQPRGGGS